MNKPCSVLIVDDNKLAAGLLCEFLEISGHRVRVAYSGAMALEIAQTDMQDAFIVDIMLPDMNGYALAAALREAKPRARMIALSGLPSSIAQDGQGLFDAWMEKPVKLDVLERLLIE
ncbi:MAG: response regulator [Burkholderiaceae bacterium]|jgi:two-component system OmpR family response regulator|nr:response regulator [Burkholderiaceae bacterium]